jgi:DNA-binding MurR/RpiR family transcriptional regulator
MQLMAATHLSPRDAMILTSHSGEDKDAIALAELAKKQQVPLIVITGSPTSRLVKMADAAFVAVAEESRYRTEALHALIAEISIMDTLFMISAIKTDSQTAPLFRQVRATIDATRH